MSTILHDLTFFLVVVVVVVFFSGNALYNCHFCQSVKEIPALNSNDEKRQDLDYWS